ncbi:MAG: tetratricopeptide repeat protein, partial [Rhizobiaceae bacterium]|nr:tetratricopeptide repeat protein [Rhizobiaceae bacterium]
LLAQVEKHLADNPSDLRGWSVVAPVYLRLGRFDQAAAAYRSIIRLGGSTPDAQAGLGEALVGAGDGLVTEEARKAFEAALEQDPGSIRARFFLAIAAEQDGAREDAAKRWRALLEDPADPDGGWREVARNRLAALGAPGPDADAVRAAEDMSAADRDAMIRGMVEGLAARLEKNPDDLDGWMRLVRAYTVLGEAEAARAALGKARNAFAGDAGAGERLDGLARELGIDS